MGVTTTVLLPLDATVVVVVVSVSCNGVQLEAAGQLGRSDFSHCIIFNKDPPIVQPDCPISSQIFLPYRVGEVGQVSL